MNDLAATRLAKRRAGLNGKPEDKIRAGQIGGMNASPEGILGKIRSGIANNALMPPEVRSLAGRVGCHVPYHVNRGIVKDTCEFCQSGETSRRERLVPKLLSPVRKPRRKQRGLDSLRLSQGRSLPRKSRVFQRKNIR